MRGENAKTPDHKKKLANAMEKRWEDPEFRKKMIEKQIKAGIRLPYTKDFRHKDI